MKGSEVIQSFFYTQRETDLLYKAEELRGLDVKPRINDIDLKVLQEYYEMYLNPFIYQYDISDDNDSSSIELRFDEENFCHLIGIESIVKFAVSKKDLHNYKGKDGWDNIKNSGLSFKDLKKYNKNKFKSVKAKFVYFYLVPEIIEKPIAVEFKNEDVDPPTRIDCDILFYTQDENAVVHLGIKKDDDLGYYIPKTFFVEKLNNDGIDIYIDKQKKIVASKKNRIIML